MKLQLKKGTTNLICHVFIQDSSAGTGDGLTGLIHSNVTAYYIRPGDGSATAITLAAATLGSYTSGGFKEVSATNMPGVYEFHVPDAVLDAGADQAVIMLKGATNMPPTPLEIQLTDVDLNDGVRAGLTALPNVIPAANGGLPTVDGSNQVAGVAGLVSVGSLDSAAITDVWATDALIEAYAAKGAEGTPAELMYMIWSAVAEFRTLATGIECFKLDGTTLAMHFSTDHATDPTLRKRSV